MVYNEMKQVIKLVSKFFIFKIIFRICIWVWNKRAIEKSQS